MTSLAWYGLGVLAVGLERLAELRVSRAHEAESRARGGVEWGRAHYPPMVALHTALLAGCVLEPWLLERRFDPAVGWPMVGVVLAAQGLRWWCIRSLGWRWNTRVIVVPGLQREATGPYRFFSHPNYVAVVAEGIALPLIHGAWITAATFTALNAVLLAVRIRCEDQALAWAERPA